MNKYEIEQLIPQRAPFRMVDELLNVDGETAVTLFVVQPDNYLLDSDGVLAEAGVIEHIAQSASALAGYLSREQGNSSVPVGYIGEIRNFRCYGSACVGDVMRTTVTREDVFGDIVCVNGETWVSDRRIAELQMKIYISPND
jgi:predicted hotdog family 3-hydroxylacyl-ACP dehydratase